MIVVHGRLCQVGRLWQVAATLGLFVSIPSVACAAGWMDDFNDGSATDGNPVTWLQDLGGMGIFPGVYDASSGDYFLDPADDSPTTQMSALVPAVSFTDVYMRTQGKVLPDPNDPENDGGNLVLTARINPDDLTGYLVYFDVSGNLNLQWLANFDTDDIGVSTFEGEFNASSEVVLELNIVGTELSAYVWLADDPNGKPVTPQATASTNDLDPSLVFTSGISGVGFAEDDPFTSCIYRYVAAQDTPFVDVTSSNGDFDGDDDVDGDDFLIWQKGFGQTSGATAATGDADADGDVDDADLGVWKGNFGEAPAVGAIGAVPEPGTLALGALGLLALAAVRGRSSWK